MFCFFHYKVLLFKNPTAKNPEDITVSLLLFLTAGNQKFEQNLYLVQSVWSLTSGITAISFLTDSCGEINL